MILEIERYISNQNISEEAKLLYKEGIICYKSSAYRASFLMTYLGFMESVKYKILNSEKPQNYEEARWNKDVLHKIKNDEIWEKQVFELLIRNSNPIFKMNDSLKLEIKYWKDRRNDCAHYKKNQISNAHIEAFWQFIQSSNDKLIINDSIDQLINYFKIHFDPSKTKPGSCYNHLIEKCILILNEELYDDFFEKLNRFFKSEEYLNKNEIIYFLNDSSEEIKIISKFLEKVIPELNKFLKEFVENKNYLFELLKYNPKLLMFMELKPEDVRTLWKDVLFSDFYIENLELFCGLLRNGMIPPDEKEEAFKHLIKKYGDYLPSDDQFYVLSHYGFIDYFKEELFKEGYYMSSFEWGNKNRNIVPYLIKKCGIDEAVVIKISTVFTNEHNPWHLKKSLESFFSIEEQLKNEFIELAGDKGILLPEFIQ